MTIEEILAEAEAATPSVPPPSVIDIYFDSAAANGGDGLTPGTALNNPGAYTFQSNKVYGFKRGSKFRVSLNLSTLTNVTVLAYGTGDLPIFDTSMVANNGSFSLTSGQTVVYSINWANAFTPGLPTQHSVWEDNVRLQRATSVADCASKPGSFYPESIVLGGASVVHVHASDSSNVSTNGKTYEITHKDLGLWLGDNSKAYYVHTRRNAMNNGSFQIGINSYCFGVLAEDGVKHNMFIEDGVAEYCTVWKMDKPVEFGGATAYICYSNRNAGPLGVLLKKCSMIARFNDSEEMVVGLFGWYAHVGGSSQYNNVVIDGGHWEGASVLFGGELATPFTIKNASHRNFSRYIDGSTFFNPILSENNNISCSTDYLIFAGSQFTSKQDKVYVHNYGSAKFIRTNNPIEISIQRSTFVSNQPQFYLVEVIGTLMPVLDTKGIIFHGSGGQSVVVLATSLVDPAAQLAANVTGDQNFYAPSAIYYTGTSTDVSDLETNVTKTMAFANYSGSFINGTFYLPESHPAYGIAGSDSTFNVPPPDDNIVVGSNVRVAKNNASFSSVGITGTNTHIIYKVAGAVQSYKPGRAINPITAFEEGVGYYIVSKAQYYLPVLN